MLWFGTVAFVFTAEPRPHGVLRVIEVGAGNAFDAMGRPGLADVIGKPETDERVHERASAEGSAGEHAHPPCLRPDDPAPQVRPCPVVELLLQQIRLTRIAALLQDDDGHPGLLELCGNDGAARA